MSSLPAVMLKPLGSSYLEGGGKVVSSSELLVAVGEDGSPRLRRLATTMRVMNNNGSEIEAGGVREMWSETYCL
jgi:hypothetical protein